MKFLDLIQYDPIYFFSKFEKFAVVVVVVGSRDYNIRWNFLIRSNMIQFIFLNLKSLRWWWWWWWWWWAVGTIDSTLVLRLGLDWTWTRAWQLNLGLDDFSNVIWCLLLMNSSKILKSDSNLHFWTNKMKMERIKFNKIVFSFK